MYQVDWQSRSAERGATTTVVCAMSTGGSYVLAMILFKRKNMNHRHMKGAPPGFFGTTSDSGWMDAQLFVKYMTHFIAHTMPSENHPLLVVFDGHRSHTSLEVVELARQHHVILLTLPRTQAIGFRL